MTFGRLRSWRHLFSLKKYNLDMVSDAIGNCRQVVAHS